MKISFITTVFNEQISIIALLTSLFKQSRKPDEIVIVDGGSTDKTVQIIKKWIRKNKQTKVSLYGKVGNRSVGRNEAIKKAKGDIIVVSDAGCTLDKDWIRNITKPFSNNTIDVVAGYYKPIANNVFERCLAAYTCVMPDRVDPNNFLPSSRSVAFKKKVWNKVGGYPEWLETCEDLVFARELKRERFIFTFAKNAFVYWPQRKNLPEAFYQFFIYAKGDGMAHYFRKNTPFLFLRYIIVSILLVISLYTRSYTLFIIILLLFIWYLFWSIHKNFDYIKDNKALLYLPIIQIVSDIAVITGTSYGYVMSKSKFNEVYKQ